MNKLAAPPTLVLLVGAPRSGTTWLQSMLGSHPSIATPQETDLFSRFLQPLWDAWARQLRGGPAGWAERRYKGLAGVLTAEEFDAFATRLVTTTVEAVTALKPTASIVVEKTPSHSLCAESIRAYAPDARIVHLVRDGRDVAASLLAASEGWGKAWAPGSLAPAARLWVDFVRGARRIHDLGLPYLEVRYEDLRAGGAAALGEVFAFCGLELDEPECTALLDSFGLHQMGGESDDAILVGGEFARLGATREEPAGFFRRGEVGGWRTEWRTHERLVFHEVAGDLLVELGYEPDGSWAGDRRALRSFRRRDTALRVVARAAQRVGRRGNRIARRLP